MSFEEISRRQPGHDRRLIDGTITGANKCIGYCSCKLHPGFVTEVIADRKQCSSRGCWYFSSRTKKSETFTPSIGALIDLSAIKLSL